MKDDAFYPVKVFFAILMLGAWVTTVFYVTTLVIDALKAAGTC